MIGKENLMEIFEGAGSMEKEDAIKQAMDKCKLSKKTAESYYYTWKSNYMKAGGSLNSSRDKSTKAQKKISTETKETSKKPKVTLRLDIIGVTLTGENGTYKLCKDGLELSNEGQTLSFENVHQWENFKAEVDRAFELGKSSKVFDS